MVRAAGNAPALWPCAAPPEAGASLLGYALGVMDGHQGIAPCTPVWRTGMYLSTPMPGSWSPVLE